MPPTIIIYHGVYYSDSSESTHQLTSVRLSRLAANKPCNCLGKLSTYEVTLLCGSIADVSARPWSSLFCSSLLYFVTRSTSTLLQKLYTVLLYIKLILSYLVFDTVVNIIASLLIAFMQKRNLENVGIF